MYISYDYYRIFYYVAKCRSVTQAANILMNNQPNITRTIKKLEQELGCTLFLRSNRGVRLTPEGEKLYAHVCAAVEQIQAGEEELAMESSLRSGAVSIGVTEVALRCLLLPALEQYHRQYPGILLRISNYSTPQALAALKNGVVDIAVVTTPTGDCPSLTVRRVREYREVAVCGSDFSALAEAPIALETLAGAPIISLGPQTGTYEFYANWFLQMGMRFAPHIEAATADQILPLVRRNLGVGFVPEAFLLEEKIGTDIFPLELKEEIPLRAICCVTQTASTLSVAARALEAMVINGISGPTV